MGDEEASGEEVLFFFFSYGDKWFRFFNIYFYSSILFFKVIFAVSTPSVWVPFMQDPMETNPRLPEFKNYQCFSSQLIVLQWSSLILRFKQKIIWMTTA